MDHDHTRQQGFTLIELMVVVLIIAILLAIAIPTFLGARENAQRRATQSNVRNALTTEMIFYADHAEFTEVPADLTAQDSSLTYANLLTDLGPPRIVYVDVQSSPAQTNDTVYLAGRTPSGECFWVRIVGSQGLPRFAMDDCTGTSLNFTSKW